MEEQGKSVCGEDGSLPTTYPLKAYHAIQKKTFFNQGLFPTLCVPFCLRQTKNLENKSPPSPPCPRFCLLK